MGAERKVVSRFDVNDDGWLNAEERATARAALKEEAANAPAGRGPGGRRGPGGGGGGPPGMGGMGREEEPVGPGPKVSPDQVKLYPDVGMFDGDIVRTLFMDFEGSDWEAELAEFHGTDVDVPCTLTVDGVKYPNVGVHFRGSSSYMMVGPGHKRSYNLAIDLADDKQRLYGVKTLNLLNAHEDPSFLCSILYSHIARQYIPAPRANLVKVVINGESWGVFASVEQFNKDFVKENFGSSDGARWKVKGSPMARSGLDYIGENLDDYKGRYQIKSASDDEDWQALIELCRTLTETPLEELESALRPMLDIDGALWFLALDNALVNCDGYWIRSSDYNLYRDPRGVFHLVPHDMNEAFVGTVMAPGFGGRGQRGQGMRPGNRPDGMANGPPPQAGAGDGPPAERTPQDVGDQPRQGRPPQPGPQRPTGIELDPLTGMDDATKPLRSRLLAVPSLRAKYLANVKTIASQALTWDALGPIVAQYRELIGDEIKADTRKLTSYEAFLRATADDLPAADAALQQGRPRMSLRQFAEQRSQFLQNYQAKPSQPNEGAAVGASQEQGQ